MNEARSHEGTRGRSRHHHPQDFPFAFGLAVLTASLHTYALVAEFVRAADFRTVTSPTILYVFLMIELGLLVNIVGLWLRRAAGIRTSIIALLVVGFGHVFWYIYSRQILAVLLAKPSYQLHPEAVPPHPFGLMGATWLNLLVLLISGVLLIWELKAAASQSSR